MVLCLRHKGRLTAQEEGSGGNLFTAIVSPSSGVNKGQGVNCEARNGEQSDYHDQRLILLSPPSTSPDPDIVNGVYWSEALNKVFVDNFERDPTLIWQYFGSAKGFFRQYPGQCCHS